MRLIDAGALMYRVHEETREAPNWDYAVGYCDAIKRVECMIGEAPTVAEDNNVPIKQPGPITGLVPCGCGGKAKIWPSDPTQFTHVITDYEVGCTECAMTTGWVHGKQENAMNVWNTAMGQKGGAK